MALVYCPKCGQSVSDKASSCPHCGFALSGQNTVLQNTIKCEECGDVYEVSLSSCPTCGCPTPAQNIEPQKPKKKHMAIIITAIVLAVLLIIGLLGLGVSKKVKAEKYYNNMVTAAYTILDGAADAENAGNLIKSVWYNAIYEVKDSATDKYTMRNGKFVDDFNDALSNLFSDGEFTDSITKITDNQSQVAVLMKELRNPPKEYEEAYSVLKAYYDNYLKMTQLVVNPKGSLQSFAEDFNKADTDTANSYEEMKLYID